MKQKMARRKQRDEPYCDYQARHVWPLNVRCADGKSGYDLLLASDKYQ